MVPPCRKPASHCDPRDEAPRQARCPLEAHSFLRHTLSFLTTSLRLTKLTLLNQSTTAKMVSFRSLALAVAVGYVSAQEISTLDQCAVSQLLYGVSLPLFCGLPSVFYVSSGAAWLYWRLSKTSRSRMRPPAAEGCVGGRLSCVPRARPPPPRQMADQL